MKGIKCWSPIAQGRGPSVKDWRVAGTKSVKLWQQFHPSPMCCNAHCNMETAVISSPLIFPTCHFASHSYNTTFSWHTGGQVKISQNICNIPDKSWPSSISNCYVMTVAECLRSHNFQNFFQWISQFDLTDLIRDWFNWNLKGAVCRTGWRLEEHNKGVREGGCSRGINGDWFSESLEIGRHNNGKNCAWLRWEGYKRWRAGAGGD